MTVIRVDARARGYEVMVGPIEAGIERILDLAQGATPVLVSEPRVFALHGTSVAEALGAQPILVLTGKGEQTREQGSMPKKTMVFDSLADVSRHLIAHA